MNDRRVQYIVAAILYGGFKGSITIQQASNYSKDLIDAVDMQRRGLQLERRTAPKRERRDRPREAKK